MKSPDNLTWTAEWIWLPTEAETDYIYADARQTITLENDVECASLAIAANNIYRLFVNGHFVGRGPDRADPRFPYYDVHDVTDLLTSGTNVIGVEVYAVTTTSDRGRMWALYGGEPGLLLQLSCDSKNGQVQFGTDASWKMRQSPCWQHGAPRITRFLGYVEHFDGTQAAERTAWHSADYADASWPSAKTLGVPPDGPLGPPLPREIPPLVPVRREPTATGSVGRDHRTLSPDVGPLGFFANNPMLLAHANGETVDLTLDFGRSMGGFLDLSLARCSGGRLEIFYGEDTHRVLSEIVDLPSNGALSFTSFDWRGTRHVCLRFSELSEDVEIRGVAFIEHVYPFSDTGEFEANEPRLGEIWRRCRETARVAVKDHPMDCVHREQALWVSDLLTHFRAALTCFSDPQPFIKALRQALRNVTDDGIMPVPGPCGVGYHFDDDILPWSEQPMMVAVCAAELYRYTGDVECIRELLPPLHRVMRHFARYRQDNGLLQVDKPDLQDLSPFCGWSPSLKEHGVPVTVNAEYVMALRAMATLAAAAGESEAGMTFGVDADRLAATLTDRFYNAQAHLFVDGEIDGQLVDIYSPTANAYAVLAGLLPEGEGAGWASAMENDARVSPLSSAFDAGTVLEAYLIAGAEDAARRLLEACWGQYLDLNEPCIPERWLPGHDSMLAYGRGGISSRCHPYAAAPAYCLNEYVLGIRIAEPGGSRVTVAPMALGLSLARGRVRLPQGDLSVFWRRSRHEWYLELEVPAGVVADVDLPRPALGATRFEVDGKVLWQTDGWARYREAVHLRPPPSEPTTLQTQLTAPGRHIVSVNCRLSSTLS